MCEREREREMEREREKDFDDVDDDGYVVDGANVVDVDAIDFAAIVDAASVDANLAANFVVIVASGAAHLKAHKQYNRPRSPFHFGRRYPRRHCPFSKCSSNFLLDPAAVKPVAAIRQSRATIEE